MRILHITALAARGGCEKNCYHFINGCKNSKHNILILDKDGPMTNEWINIGAHVISLNVLGDSLISFWKKIKKSILNKEFDLIICWTTIRLPVLLSAISKTSNQIKVYLGNPLSHNPLKDFILKLFFKQNSFVELMACSSHVAKSYDRIYYKKFPIKVSLNPVPIPLAFPEKQLDKHTFKLGMVARLDPIKDHRTVIFAFKNVVEKVQGLELHLVGYGILLNELKEMVNQLSINNCVFFHGEINNVYEVLNTWNLFLYSTTLKEGLGSVVEEAMANGMPCILSDLPMLRELAPNNETVEWFEPGNAEMLAKKIEELYLDKEKRHKLSRNAFTYASQNFGINRFINDYIEKL